MFGVDFSESGGIYLTAGAVNGGSISPDNANYDHRCTFIRRINDTLYMQVRAHFADGLVVLTAVDGQGINAKAVTICGGAVGDGTFVSFTLVKCQVGLGYLKYIATFFYRAVSDPDGLLEKLLSVIHAVRNNQSRTATGGQG